MAREPIPTWYFVLVIVRLGHRFLLVKEAKHGQNWYLPAGRVELGETLLSAAKRETLEEAGIPVVIEGILRMEHQPYRDGTSRLRVILVGRSQDDTPPKKVADQESLEAGWFSLHELDKLSLRGQEVREMLQYVSNGGAIYPLSLLTFEGAPFKV